MRTLLVVSLLSLPSLALAGDDQPYPPPPPGSAPLPPPPPEPAQQPPGPPPGSYQQPPPGSYQQPPPGGQYGAQQPVYQQAPVSNRNGLTFEANIGFGLLHFSGEGDSDSEGALGGIALGLGGWINEKMAVTARLAPVTYFESNDGGDFYLSAIFFGPSVQYWIDDHIWLGGGAGLAIARLAFSGGGESASDSRTGLGLDLRAGYTFSTSTDSTWNVSAEITPGFYSDNDEGSGGQFTGLALLLGYQHL